MLVNARVDRQGKGGQVILIETKAIVDFLVCVLASLSCIGFKPLCVCVCVCVRRIYQISTVVHYFTILAISLLFLTTPIM